MAVQGHSPASIVEVGAGRMDGELPDTPRKVYVTVETLVDRPSDVPQAAAVAGRRPQRARADHLAVAGVDDLPVDAPFLLGHLLLPMIRVVQCSGDSASARAVRAAGSTLIPFIGERSITSPPSQIACPPTPWPPERPATSSA